jgi:hypothetical protein
VDSASRVGDDVDLFRAMNRREISVLTVYESSLCFLQNRRHGTCADWLESGDQNIAILGIR